VLQYICGNIAPSMSTKVTSLRLPDYMAAELAAVARTDDMPVSEAVREAIEKHIADRRSDQDFQKRLKKRLEEDQEVLKRLVE
jgi:predicted DNA-binding protein